MTNDHDSVDILETLARYAPTAETVGALWNVDQRSEALTAVLGDRRGVGSAAEPAGPAVYDIPMRYLPARAATRRRRWSAGFPVAASVAVVAVAAGIVAVVAAVGGSRGHDVSAGGGGARGPAFDPPAGLSHTAIGASQYSYRVDEQLDVAANGRPEPGGVDAMVNRNWISATGDIVSVRTGRQNGCFQFPHSGSPGFTEPTRAFFAGLPTDVGALTSYLRSHVDGGSSTKDHAVFVSVGDMLRTADGLASPALRGALVGVLSRTAGITVHENETDYSGRPAIRVDFVDQRIEPGAIDSLFFDPTTFQFLAERSGRSGQPSEYNGPSPAYDDASTDAPTAAGALAGSAYVDVMTVEKVVDALPALPADCTQTSNGG